MSAPDTILEILGDDKAVGTASQDTSSAIEISVQHETEVSELESTQFLEVWDGRGPEGQPGSKRRVVSGVTTPTLTVDSDSYDMAVITAQATSLTIAAPTGTPFDGQGLMFRIEDNGTSRSVAWNGIFRGIGTTPPVVTTATKTLYVGTIYNSVDSKWDVIAIGQEA